jgi:hypothetical protein
MPSAPPPVSVRVRSASQSSHNSPPALSLSPPLQAAEAATEEPLSQRHMHHGAAKMDRLSLGRPHPSVPRGTSMSLPPGAAASGRRESVGGGRQLMQDVHAQLREQLQGQLQHPPAPRAAPPPEDNSHHFVGLVDTPPATARTEATPRTEDSAGTGLAGAGLGAAAGSSGEGGGTRSRGSSSAATAPVGLQPAPSAVMLETLNRHAVVLAALLRQAGGVPLPVVEPAGSSPLSGLPPGQRLVRRPSASSLVLDALARQGEALAALQQQLTALTHAPGSASAPPPRETDGGVAQQPPPPEGLADALQRQAAELAGLQEAMGRMATALSALAPPVGTPSSGAEAAPVDDGSNRGDGVASAV